MRHRLLAVSIAALCMAACAGPPPGNADGEDAASQSLDAGDAGDASASAHVDAALRDEDVVVSTNEPFWQAHVEGDAIVLRGPEVERRFEGATSSMTSDGRRIVARDDAGEVVVIVRRMRCEDDMSGARFPMTGLLTIDGQGPFRGCARPASMPQPAEPS